MPRRVAIVGVGLTRCSSWRKDVAYPELVYEASSAALQDAGITAGDVGAVVYGSMDPFDGVNAPEKWNVDACAAAGMLEKPYLKISTGGTTGGSTALAAYYHVASGLHDVALAVCSQRVGETLEAQLVLNTAVDPIYERGLGMGAIMISLHKDYADYSRLISTLKQDWQPNLRAAESFLCSVKRPEIVAKPFSLKYLAEQEEK